VAFQSFVVLVFIWLGDGSRLNKSCLHDLGVPYHHCYRVSSPLLVEFISFWYQSFGSKISFVYLLFSFYFLFLAIIKKKKKKNEKKKKKKAKKKKEKKKVQNSSKKKKKNLPFNLLSARKLLLFQKEKSLHFNLVSTRK
jgi:predicted membrane protein